MLDATHKFFALGLSIVQWEELLVLWNEPTIHAKSLFKLTFSEDPLQAIQSQLYTHSLKSKITKYIDFSTPSIKKETNSCDGTKKFLLNYDANASAEAALLNFFKRKTFCLSSQVGCAMKCSFCLTGTRGLSRNLEPHEIVGQYKKLFFQIDKNKRSLLPPQIVFMGEGEPLQNFENIKKALQILTHPLSFNLGPKNITISSVGILSSLDRWHELPNVNLAFSLHAGAQKLRETLIPSAISNPLNELIQKIDQIHYKTKKFIIMEYILIDNLNTQDDHILELFELLEPRKNYCILNLIPYNEHSYSEWKKPNDTKIYNIFNQAINFGIRTFIRKTKGSDINAACGQLKGAGAKIREPASPQQKLETSQSISGEWANTCF